MSQQQFTEEDAVDVAHSIESIFRISSRRRGSQTRPEYLTGELVSNRFGTLTTLQPSYGRYFLPTGWGVVGRNVILSDAQTIKVHTIVVNVYLNSSNQFIWRAGCEDGIWTFSIMFGCGDLAYESDELKKVMSVQDADNDHRERRYNETGLDRACRRNFLLAIAVRTFLAAMTPGSNPATLFGDASRELERRSLSEPLQRLLMDGFKLMFYEMSGRSPSESVRR